MPVLPNAKHEIVAQQVATGKSWEEAMLVAGYAKRTARTQMGRLSANVSVQQRIAEFQQAMANAKLVSAARLHERWSEMFEADIADIMQTKACECAEVDRADCKQCVGSGLVPTGAYKPITAWPRIWRQMLSGVDVKEMFEHSKDGTGRSWDKIGEVVKLKFVGVKDLGELIGRHKAVDAFVNPRQEIDLNIRVDEEINNRIAAGRRRAAQRNAKTRETTKATT
jgi:phage terminase small subunit